MKSVEWLEDSDITPVPGSLPQQPEPVREHRSGQRISVLLVEDNPAEASWIELLLRNVSGATFRITALSRLSEAVEFLARERVHVILLDLGLPDSHGLETYLRLQKSVPDIPVVVLTGNDDSDLAGQAVREGAQDYLIKGTDASGLVRAMRYAISRSRLRKKVVRALKEAKTNEANFRAVIDRTLNGIVVADAAGIVRHANRAAEQLFGYRSGQFVGRQFGFKLVPGEQQEVAIIHLNGTELPIEIRVVGIEWGGELAHLALLHDLRERRQLESNRAKLLLARQVQEALLPRASPNLPGFDIAGASLTAEETGGDYFDFVPMAGGRLGLVIGDASDHGFPAAILISGAAAALCAIASVETEVGRVLSLLNRQLSPRTPEGQFVTLILASLDPVTRVLTYGNAGHPSALLFDAAGQLQCRLKSLDVPLTVLADCQYVQASIPFPSGGLAVLMSDGVIEAMAPNGQPFGTDRLIEVIRAHRHRTADQIVKEVCQAISAFTAPTPPHDDITLVVVKSD